MLWKPNCAHSNQRASLELGARIWVWTIWLRPSTRTRTLAWKVCMQVFSPRCLDHLAKCLAVPNVLVASNCWIQGSPVQTHPCFHTSLFCSSRQAMIRVAFENTDSISTSSIGSVGNSGFITRLTRKCFCLAKGVTAVHFVNSSFLGFKAFTGLPDNRWTKARPYLLDWYFCLSSLNFGTLGWCIQTRKKLPY